MSHLHLRAGASVAKALFVRPKQSTLPARRLLRRQKTAARNDIIFKQNQLPAEHEAMRNWFMKSKTDIESLDSISVFLLLFISMFLYLATLIIEEIASLSDGYASCAPTSVATALKVTFPSLASSLVKV